MQAGPWATCGSADSDGEVGETLRTRLSRFSRTRSAVNVRAAAEKGRRPRRRRRVVADAADGENSVVSAPERSDATVGALLEELQASRLEVANLRAQQVVSVSRAPPEPVHRFRPSSAPRLQSARASDRLRATVGLLRQELAAASSERSEAKLEAERWRSSAERMRSELHAFDTHTSAKDVAIEKAASAINELRARLAEAEGACATLQSDAAVQAAELEAERAGRASLEASLDEARSESGRLREELGLVRAEETAERASHADATRALRADLQASRADASEWRVRALAAEAEIKAGNAAANRARDAAVAERRRHEAELSRLRDDVRSKADAVARAARETAELRADSATLAASLHVVEEAAAAAHAAKAAETKARKQAERDLANLRATRDDTDRALAESQSLLSRARREAREAAARHEAEKRRGNGEYERLAAENEAALVEAARWRERCAGAERSRDSLQSRLESTASRSADLEAAARDADTAVATAEQELQRERQACKALRAENANLLHEVERLESEIRAASSSRHEVREVALAHDAAINERDATIMSLRANVESLRSELASRSKVQPRHLARTLSGVSGVLRVVARRGERLRSVQRVGRQDPYVVVTLFPTNASLRTQTLKDGGRDPVWDTVRHGAVLDFVYRSAAAATGGNSDYLRVEVFDSETLGGDRLIGQCDGVSFEAAVGTPNSEHTLRLPLVTKRGDPAGHIVVDVLFLSDGSDASNEAPDVVDGADESDDALLADNHGDSDDAYFGDELSEEEDPVSSAKRLIHGSMEGGEDEDDETSEDNYSEVEDEEDDVAELSGVPATPSPHGYERRLLATPKGSLRSLGGQQLARTLSSKELEHARSIFDDFDTDNSGDIDTEELFQILWAHRGELGLTFSMNGMRQFARSEMRNADTQGFDAKLNREEFAALYAGIIKKQGSDVQERARLKEEGRKFSSPVSR